MRPFSAFVGAPEEGWSATCSLRPHVAHVLVPIDLSARSARVLQIVERLPTKRVTLLHVIHQVPGLPTAELRPFYKRLQGRAERVVQRAAAKLSASGLRVQHAVTSATRRGRLSARPRLGGPTSWSSARTASARGPARGSALRAIRSPSRAAVRSCW